MCDLIIVRIIESFFFSARLTRDRSEIEIALPHGQHSLNLHLINAV